MRNELEIRETAIKTVKAIASAADAHFNWPGKRIENIEVDVSPYATAKIDVNANGKFKLVLTGKNMRGIKGRRLVEITGYFAINPSRDNYNPGHIRVKQIRTLAKNLVRPNLDLFTTHLWLEVDDSYAKAISPLSRLWRISCGEIPREYAGKAIALLACQLIANETRHMVRRKQNLEVPHTYARRYQLTVSFKDNDRFTLKIVKRIASDIVTPIVTLSGVSRQYVYVGIGDMLAGEIVIKEIKEASNHGENWVIEALKNESVVRRSVIDWFYECWSITWPKAKKNDGRS